MNPLRVAVIVKPKASTARDGRNMGWWSYPVPEFTWEYLGDLSGLVDRRRFRDFDLIFHEDGGNWCKYSDRRSGPPVAFLSVDSTLSDGHYRVRLEQAQNADVVLLDHDNPARFPLKKPVHQWPYCVNDRIYTPGDKTTDINFLCSCGGRNGTPGAEERAEMRFYLEKVSKAGCYSYRSGTLDPLVYADAMGRSKVVVNLPRTPTNRPHRVFDAMAAGACLLTAPLPPVVEDWRKAGLDYVEFDNRADLPVILYELIKCGGWAEYAETGRRLVMTQHTWARRARELREILATDLGL